MVAWPLPLGKCVYDGPRCRLFVPEGARRSESEAYEWGHALQHTGLAHELRAGGCPSWRLEKMREDAGASRFGRTLLIPLRLALSDLPDWEVAEACDCSEAAVRQRRADLAR